MPSRFNTLLETENTPHGEEDSDSNEAENDFQVQEATVLRRSTPITNINYGLAADNWIRTDETNDDELPNIDAGILRARENSDAAQTILENELIRMENLFFSFTDSRSFNGLARSPTGYHTGSFLNYPGEKTCPKSDESDPNDHPETPQSSTDVPQDDESDNRTAVPGDEADTRGRDSCTMLPAEDKKTPAVKDQHDDDASLGEPM